MLEIIVFVAAFVVAQLLAAFAMVAILLNKRVLKWYYKKCVEIMTMDFEEEED